MMNWRIESGTYVLRGEFLQDRFQFHNYLHNRNRRHVAASTQNVALCALLFLYRQVLAIDLPLIENIERARRPKRVPVVVTPGEVRRVLANIHGTHLMMASLLYGAGLRLILLMFAEN